MFAVLKAEAPRKRTFLEAVGDLIGLRRQAKLSRQTFLGAEYGLLYFQRYAGERAEKELLRLSELAGQCAEEFGVRRFIRTGNPEYDRALVDGGLTPTSAEAYRLHYAEKVAFHVAERMENPEPTVGIYDPRLFYTSLELLKELGSRFRSITLYTGEEAEGQRLASAAIEEYGIPLLLAGKTEPVRKDLLLSFDLTHKFYVEKGVRMVVVDLKDRAAPGKGQLSVHDFRVRLPEELRGLMPEGVLQSAFLGACFEESGSAALLRFPVQGLLSEGRSAGAEKLSRAAARQT